MTEENARLLVNKICPELRVSFTETESSYLDGDEIGLNITMEEDYGLFRHLKEWHKCEFAEDYSLAMWGILHELGHHFCPASPQRKAEEDMVRSLCNLAYSDEQDDPEGYQDLYFNLPSEWLATEWAIRYIRDNKDYIKSLDC